MKSNNNTSSVPFVIAIGISIAFIFILADCIFLCLVALILTGVLPIAIWQIEKESKELKEKQKAEQAKKESLTPKYNSEKDSLISKYGQPDKTIILEDLNIEKEIIAFGSANRIWILGCDLSMDDVIGYSLNDNQHTIKGSTFYETNTNMGSMATRAIVGGVLTGGVGAIVGGATAKKETVAIQGNDETIHDYTVFININSLSSPVIKIPLGKDYVKANEIIGLMNVVINRNNQK